MIIKQSPPFKRARRRFTLIEVLVLCLLSLFLGYKLAPRTEMTEEQKLEIQQDIRTTHLLLQEYIKSK